MEACADSKAQVKGSGKETTYNPNKIVRNSRVFSSHHPLIPHRYVPQWQLDMKNRKLIAWNSQMARNSLWKGHVSYFLCGRERLDATNHRLYQNMLEYSRLMHSNDSHMSRYNSGMINMVNRL